MTTRWIHSKQKPSSEEYFHDEKHILVVAVVLLGWPFVHSARIVLPGIEEGVLGFRACTLGAVPGEVIGSLVLQDHNRVARQWA